MKPRSKTQMDQGEEAWILLNHKTMTVPRMAALLGRSVRTIYQHMKDEDLTPHRADPKPRSDDHPFRKRNRQLETKLLGIRIQNANRKI